MSLLSKSEIDEVLRKNKLTAAETIFHEYHGEYLINDTLSDSDVLVIALFLREGLKKYPEADKVKLAYLSLGRAFSTWDNAVKHATKDNLVEARGGCLFMLIAGLKRVEDIFGLSGTKHYIFKSGKTFSAQKQFEDFLKAEIEKGEILLCDPYIDPSTLYPFLELLSKTDTLKILSSNISQKEKFETCLKRLQEERGNLVQVKINQKLHDRYLISGSKCWLIGTSIKNLGNKDCIIKETSEIAQSLTELFWERWKESG